MKRKHEWHADVECSTGTQYAVDFLQDLLRVPHMLERADGDDAVNRTIRHHVQIVRIGYQIDPGSGFDVDTDNPCISRGRSERIHPALVL